MLYRNSAVTLTVDKMKRNLLIATAVVAVIIIVAAGYGGYKMLGSNSTDNPEPTATPQLSTQEQVRNDVMNYIKTAHPETVQYMQSFSWTGGDVTQPGLVGASTYNYTSGGWNVIITYPIVPNPLYTCTVKCYNLDSPSTFNPLLITWQGTWQSGTITQKSYEGTSGEFPVDGK
jgi:hypothetical protein